MRKSLFETTGVHCIVDGQFGSTGKGALAAWLAYRAVASGYHKYFNGVITSAGPNSGHTSYWQDQMIVLKQLPTFAVHMLLHKNPVPIYLSAGAVIDRDILAKEAKEWPDLRIFVHPNAAVVSDSDKDMETSGSVAEVAGTRSGTGWAIARKVLREPEAIARNVLGDIAPNVVLAAHRPKPEEASYFMEVSQGFSLGLNSEFYPKVTSRECTVMQGLADARIPPRHLARTYMAIRCHPIRVGNVDGYSSGDWYGDQKEISWEELGKQPELTTVTKRVRRVATFSSDQFYDALEANDPEFVFISHLDYLERDAQGELLEHLRDIRKHRNKPYGLIMSRGPKLTDIVEET